MQGKKNVSRPEEIQRKDLKGLKMTEWDRRNMAYLIGFFRKAFPGVIEEISKQARADTVSVARQKTEKDSLNFTRRLAMPSGLLKELKKSYPALIVDKNQFEQFLAWFPEFDLLKR